MHSVWNRWPVVVGISLGAAACCASMIGCGNDKPPATPTATATKPKGPVTPAQEKAVAKAADDNQGGNLSISADILRLCPGIKPPKFGFDSAAVKDEWREAIQSLAECMNNGGMKGKGVLLTGLTDPRGEEDYNMQLGGRRAESVKEALMSFGVEGRRVDVTSRGEADAKGTDEATWAQDRRVEMRLRPNGTLRQSTRWATGRHVPRAGCRRRRGSSRPSACTSSLS